MFLSPFGQNSLKWGFRPFWGPFWGHSGPKYGLGWLLLGALYYFWGIKSTQTRPKSARVENIFLKEIIPGCRKTMKMVECRLGKTWLILEKSNGHKIGSTGPFLVIHGSKIWFLSVFKPMESKKNGFGRKQFPKNPIFRALEETFLDQGPENLVGDFQGLILIVPSL